VLSIGLDAVLVDRQAVAGQRSPAPSQSGLELDSIDRTVDPCVDFYQFACGGWIAAHPVPPDLAGIGRGREMRARTFAVLQRILTTSSRDPERQKATSYYHACMDEAAIEAKGLAQIDAVIARLAGLRTREELPALLAHLHSIAFHPAIPGRQVAYGALFEFRSQHDAPHQIAAMSQSGMALPFRELYLSMDPRSSLLREAFAAHVRQMLAMLGASPEAATSGSRAVLEIETALATASADSVQQRAPDTRRMSRSELQAMMPHFNWSAYLAVASASTTSIDVSTPSFAKAVDTIVAEMPISSLKSYFQWQVAHASVLMMPMRFRQADFDFFKRTLRGQQQLEPRSELCVAETDDRLGDILGKAFVQETFGPKSKADMLTLVAELRTAMSDNIDTASWMSDATKRAAKVKLASMVERIGYPDRWQNYSTIDIRKDEALGNLQRTLAFERAMDLQKIGRPPDPDEWPRLSAARSEAGYQPERNGMIFPAGFLQPPFYSATRDAAVNYGGIGAVIGHEITHAFDDIGRRLDDRGNWRDWWTAADASAFQERAACMVDQYSQYAVGSGVNISGRLTLGENIADNGGVRLALLAYLAGPGAESPPILDGFTPVQRVFLGWAQAWCQNVRPEAERLSVATDAHAPSRYRVNGPLSNMAEFRSAFSCASGAPMVRPRICRVW
jgi:predicted metalloendopeptidase